MKKEEQEKAGIPLLPHYVELTLVLWDNSYQKDSTWKFTIPLLPPSQPPVPKLPTPQSQQQTQKTENKSTQPVPATTGTTGTTGATGNTATGATGAISKGTSTASPIKTSFNFPEGFRAGIPEGVTVGPHWDKLPASQVIRPNLNTYVD